MATDGFCDANGYSVGVKLRKKSDRTAGRNGNRASKVSSMIELFSNRNDSESKPLVRNFTIVNQRTTQEVIECENGGEKNASPERRRFIATSSKPALHNTIKNLEQEASTSVKTTSKQNFDASYLSPKSETVRNKASSGNSSQSAFGGDSACTDSRAREMDQNGGFDMKEKGQKFAVSNGTGKKSVLDFKPGRSDDRRISNARNYWEHKIEAKNDFSTRGLKSDPILGGRKPHTSPNKLSPCPEHNVKKVEMISSEDKLKEPRSVAERARTFASPSMKPSTERPVASGPMQTNPVPIKRSNNSPGSHPKPKNEIPRMIPNSNIEEKPQKPAVPARPRIVTSSGVFQSVSPKPYGFREEKSAPQGGVKSRAANFEKRPVSPLVKSSPPSPRLKINRTETQATSSQSVAASDDKKRLNDGNNNAVVNPIPKPERTFTFAAVDAIPVHVKQKPKHKNVIRVSSDLSTIHGPGIGGNLVNVLANDLHKSNPDISTRSPKEGYEEVAFCKVEDNRSRTIQPTRNTTKWQKQHNYEDVDDIAVTSPVRKTLAASYDHISLDQCHSARPLSLSDINSGYSQLKFQQDLHTSHESQSGQFVDASPSHQHMKLKKQNSDMSDVISRTGSITKSERSMENRKMLQITDKIREAFTQISRKYRHHRRNAEDGEDVKSLSSSGDEDSDTEMDLNKHRQTLDRVRTLQKTYRNTIKYKSLERELSKSEEVKVFEQVFICKIVKDQDDKMVSKVSYRFPAPPPGKNIGDEKTLAHFCFPDIDAVEPCEEMPSQSYSFMLTRENGTRKFGYCRRILPPGNGPRYPVVYCLISPMGSFGMYESVLDELELRHRTSLKRVSVFLESLFVKNFPAPGRSTRVEIEEADGSSHFVLRRPYDTRLEHVDLQSMLSELGVENTIKVFSSLLLERRVILCGRSLSILTACIYALRALLYPFVWQHVFVPVLPPPMVDLCCSPTPLLIGILETSQEKLKTLPLEEVFIFNLSSKEVLSSAGDEMEILPRKLQTPLIDTLTLYASLSRGMPSQPSYDFAIDYESAERNTVISEAFMHLFVEMIGHYQNHFQQVIQPSSAGATRFGRIQRNFNRVSFYEDITSRSLRRFLDLFMGTQMFDGFIHSRELASPDYEGLFERRIAYHLRNADASSLNFKVIRTKMKKLMQGIGKKK